MSTVAAGLTTTRAPFIEQARKRGELYIRQPYDLYSPENHQTWRTLYRRIRPRWEKYANRKFMEGVNNLMLDPEHVPKLDDVNRFLSPLTGFKAKPVSGYIPAYLFFDCLRQREFPTTITVRDGQHLDYLPEPDIFHDVAGHVPMHTDPRFADVLVRFGEAAHTAALLVQKIGDEADRVHQAESIIRAMARFFWFTIEFGLMRQDEQLKAYGSGLLSSYGELEYSIESPDVQRYPIQLEWVINQSFEIDHYQPLLFIVEGFDHLFELVDDLEKWMKTGRLSHVAPGEPQINNDDMKSFLEAEVQGG
jgi:phenylalanine-4-hydroxylase